MVQSSSSFSWYVASLQMNTLEKLLITDLLTAELWTWEKNEDAFQTPKIKCYIFMPAFLHLQ